MGEMCTVGCVLLSVECLPGPRTFCPPKPPTVTDFDVTAVRHFTLEKNIFGNTLMLKII